GVRIRIPVEAAAARAGSTEVVRVPVHREPRLEHAVERPEPFQRPTARFLDGGVERGRVDVPRPRVDALLVLAEVSLQREVALLPQLDDGARTPAERRD